MFALRLIFLVLLACHLFHPASSLASAQSSDVRVMSYNIRYGTAKDGDNHWDKRKEFLVETIKTFDPDLLGTQETLGFQRDYLAEKLAGYDVSGVGRDDVVASGFAGTGDVELAHRAEAMRPRHDDSAVARASDPRLGAPRALALTLPGGHCRSTPRLRG